MSSTFSSSRLHSKCRPRREPGTNDARSARTRFTPISTSTTIRVQFHNFQKSHVDFLSLGALQSPCSYCFRLIDDMLGPHLRVPKRHSYNA